ncbi:MAG: arylsulfatase [Rikenellaceae bacterium]|jgi:arylsulfatase A-like enzyme|nr:arylsulfatase [Rikenellaceae bacterium]
MKSIIAAALALPVANLAARTVKTVKTDNPAEVSDDQRLNVVYILADDLGYGDLGATGQRKFTTENIDRLRAEGMFFRQHYSGSTVSAPSRSALMTGQHTGHTPIRGNRELPDGAEGQSPLPAGTYTIARMFHEAGYATGCFGKWGLGWPGSEGDPVNQGFDEFYGYNCQRWAHRYYPDHLWHNLERVELPSNVGGRRGTYAPDLIQQQALQFIAKNGNRPFFLFMPITLPHAELLAPDDSLLWRYRGLFPEVPFRGGDYAPDMNIASYCSQREPYATFAAMVSRIDRYVGEVMAALKAAGIDGRTVVMFSSDNGPHREGGANPDFFDSYGPFRGVKRDLYEGGVHLPLFVRAPQMVRAGSTSDHICAFWDMLPTMADLAGVELPATVRTDGISIVPTLTGRGRQRQHDYLYWEFHEQGGKLAIRMGRWKGVMLNVSKPDKAVFQLFDLSTDIHEDHDVAAQHPDVVARIRDIFRTAHTESETFRFNSDALYI